MDAFNTESEKNRSMLAQSTPIFNKAGFFSDMTEDFCSPSQPDPYGIVHIRFRTLKNNVEYVFLVNNDEKHLMSLDDSDTLFDYYGVDVAMENSAFTYYFEIRSGKLKCYYDRRGSVNDLNDWYRFKLIPGFKTPSWSQGAIMYQIYTDRFYNGDPSNDVEDREYHYLGGYSSQVKDWDKYPDQFGVREFYGGDLEGVLKKLPYLKDLGVEAIYFNPLFVSPSNHKYDTQDYDSIDPHFGKIVHDGGQVLNEGDCDNTHASKYIQRVTDKENLDASNKLFATLVEEAHKNGIRVIIDGVFNHCGSFNKWMDKEKIYSKAGGYEKGAYEDEHSPYHTFFKFFGGKWPDNNVYDGWWAHDTLPKLNYEESPKLTDYILNIGRKWVSPPYNADGWRLDVAADLGHSPEFNHEFWKKFRRAVKEANPDALILAEHYGDCESWLRGKEWDSIMNYDAFMEPLTWFLTGMEKHSDDFRPDLLNNSDAFWGAMTDRRAAMTNPSIMSAMNELSNHDHSRFLTRTNHKVGRVANLGSEAANEGINKAVMREAVLVQMTWQGCPTVYYGDEAGVCGFTDPDNRRTYPWGNEDFELIDYHRALIRIHKQNDELRRGSLLKLANGPGYISYGRFTKTDCCVMVVNNNDHEIEISIPVWRCRVFRETDMKRLILSYDSSFTTIPEVFPVNNARLKVLMPPFSAAIFKKHTTDDYIDELLDAMKV
ncbi:MAG: glycoside hydrolase family 13 protein [Lachnospiraceae bacterium]|nr:glycoside hydrolase family 13 protein [Lachnospiraceae bacterium]